MIGSRLYAIIDAELLAAHNFPRALGQFVVQGIHTTIPLHQKIFEDAEFRAGKFDTKFMERFFERQAGS